MKRDKNKKLQQFLHYSERLNKMLSNGRFESLDGRKKYSLVKRLNRLYRQLEDYFPSRALKTALAGAAFLILTLSSNKANAQNFGPNQTNPFGLVSTVEFALPEIVDIDNDGDLDIFSGEYYGGVKFFRNTGNSTSPAFDTPLQNPFGLDSVPGYIAAIDFVDIDNDGDFDAFIGSTGGNFIFCENTGDAATPNFADGVSNPFGISGLTEYAFPEMVDIDNDGDYDLFIGAYEGVIQYFENTGTASSPAFASPVNNPFNLTSLYGLAFLSFADIDNDGDMDIFSGSYSANISFFRNNGTVYTPDFGTPITNPFGLAPLAGILCPDLADLDDDGDLDLLVGEYYGSHHYFENITIPNDIGIWSLYSPTTSCELGNNEHISLEVTNYGTNSQSNYTLTYLVNGSGGASETFTTPIGPGETIVVTFTATEDFSAYGNYLINAYSELTGDSNLSNDTIYDEWVISKPFVTSFPYFEDFESGEAGWNSGGVLSSWMLGTPNGTIINSASSGISAWVTGIHSNYFDNDQSWVESPCFDLSTLVSPQISFDLWYNTEEDYDGAQVQYTTDGTTWHTIGTASESNWYNLDDISGLFSLELSAGWSGFSDDWYTYSHSVAELAGQPNVRFRFFFGSDESVNDYDGVAFDNFSVFEEPSGRQEIATLEPEVYPNPSNGLIHILNASGSKVKVMNLLGSVLLIEFPNDNNSAIDLSSFAPGTYLIQIETKDKIITKKAVIE